MVRNLDDVDRGILHALQSNAREATAADMGDMVGTSASTVRNRINYLEENVIRGYHPEIDYNAAGSNCTYSSCAERRLKDEPSWRRRR